MWRALDREAWELLLETGVLERMSTGDALPSLGKMTVTGREGRGAKETTRPACLGKRRGGAAAQAWSWIFPVLRLLAPTAGGWHKNCPK